MKTLIELYDLRPLENVLSTDMFRPERTVFICEKELAADASVRKKLVDYFRFRGLDTQIVFMEAAHYSSSSVLNTLRKAVTMYEDCALDITGGTDDELFASGMLCAEKDIPVFTYSRKRNSFFSINNAAFAERLICTLKYRAEDFFRMAGGSMRQGRVDNDIVKDYFDIIDPFFDLFMRNRSQWGDIVNYIQRISQCPKDGPVILEARGGRIIKGDRGRQLSASVEVLTELERIGMIDKLIITEDKLGFTFRSEQTRKWLRDVGSVLEIYIYKLCIDSGKFNDVHTSVVVDWDKNTQWGGVTNEIDVVAVCGTVPVFISCKTCAVDTDALNELAILRDRFGGSGARAAIVTTEKGNAAMRNRAHELDIDVIEQADIIADGGRKNIKNLAKPS